MAHVQETCEINKRTLDELDTRYEKESFSHFILQITSKDEEKLNEIYYQANYVLESKGILFIITRPGWKPTISSKFNLEEEKVISWGENSKYHYWKLSKK